MVAHEAVSRAMQVLSKVAVSHVGRSLNFLIGLQGHSKLAYNPVISCGSVSIIVRFVCFFCKGGVAFWLWALALVLPRGSRCYGCLICCLDYVER